MGETKNKLKKAGLSEHFPDSLPWKEDRDRRSREAGVSFWHFSTSLPGSLETAACLQFLKSASKVLEVFILFPALMSLPGSSINTSRFGQASSCFFFPPTFQLTFPFISRWERASHWQSTEENFLCVCHRSSGEERSQAAKEIKVHLGKYLYVDTEISSTRQSSHTYLIKGAHTLTGKHHLVAHWPVLCASDYALILASHSNSMKCPTSLPNSHCSMGVTAYYYSL